MDNTTKMGDFFASTPQGGTARLAAMTSIGVNNHIIAANISIALAKRGKHVCLITTNSFSGNEYALPGENRESLLEDLLAGRKVLAEILLEGSLDTRILPVGSTFTNFSHIDGTRQKLLVDLLAQLESAFDYLIVETAAEADNRSLHIYQAVHCILLTITPEADSLTKAFALLRALKRQYADQPVHVIVDMAGNLPNAHDIYKKLWRAAAKYLQMEPHYLGYLPSRQPLHGSVESRLAAATCDPLSNHHFEAIAERFCGIAETIVPSTSLSRHFSELCSAQKTTGESTESASVPGIKIAEAAEIPARGTLHNPGGWQDRLSDRIALYYAAHYAGLLAKREGMNRE